jgi:hypothetical protein
MKTIYKQPKRLGKANQMENIHKLNTTGSLRRIEGTSYDLIKSYATPIAYVVDVENGSFINETKVILCNEFYSMTTRKHQAKVRELYSGCAIGEFDLGGFYKRAEIDRVNVKGGVNY